MRPLHLVVTVLLIGVSLVAYDRLRGRGGPGDVSPATSGRAIVPDTSAASAAAESAHLAGDGEATLGDLRQEVEALRARVAALEHHWGEATAPAGYTGTTAADRALDEVPPVIQAAREAAALRRHEADLAAFRAQIRRADTEGRVAENDLEQAAEALAAHAQAVRDLYEGKKNASEDERAGLRLHYEALQEELRRDLGPWLPPDLILALAGSTGPTRGEDDR